MFDDVRLLVIKDKRAKSREKHRVRIHLLNAETGCRIALVGASQAGVKEGTKFILVGRDLGED